MNIVLIVHRKGMRFAHDVCAEQQGIHFIREHKGDWSIDPQCPLCNSLLPLRRKPAKRPTLRLIKGGKKGLAKARE